MKLSNACTYGCHNVAHTYMYTWLQKKERQETTTFTYTIYGICYVTKLDFLYNEQHLL